MNTRSEYPKTENLYASNGEQGAAFARGPEFGFRSEAFGLVNRWLVTEKVDGMNIRVIFEQDLEHLGTLGALSLRFGGKTDKANLPGDLLAYLQETFTIEAFIEAFRDGEEQLPESVVLYGEGFGPGIQKAGQAYSEFTGNTKRFILFDVLVDGRWWLRWDDVVDVARKLGIWHVPVLKRDATLDDVERLVDYAVSEMQAPGSEYIEGVVARTDPYLFDGRGNRVAFKHKVKG